MKAKYRQRKHRYRQYCCEDISLVENYKQASEDNFDGWHCHHKLEIGEGYINSVEDLKMMNLYFNRPANELIFLKTKEHLEIHRRLEATLFNCHNNRSKCISNAQVNKPKTEFGQEYVKHYGYGKKVNQKQYMDEYHFYNKYHKYSWNI